MLVIIDVALLLIRVQNVGMEGLSNMRKCSLYSLFRITGSFVLSVLLQSLFFPSHKNSYKSYTVTSEEIKNFLWYI